MVSGEQKSLVDELSGLDDSTRDKMDSILDRILGKIKKRDPVRYKRAVEKAEADFERNNGGRDDDKTGRTSEEDGCT